MIFKKQKPAMHSYCGRKRVWGHDYGYELGEEKNTLKLYLQNLFSMNNLFNVT